MIDDDALRERLRAIVGKERGAATRWAKENGLHDEQVSAFLRGTRKAEPKLIRAMGFRRVVSYVPD